MQIKEIVSLKDDEILAKIVSLKKELFALRLKLFNNQLNDNQSIKNNKKLIARLNTVLKQRENKERA